MIKIIRGMPASAKASIAFLFSSIITKAIAYITTPIYTRILTTEEYGQVSVFLTWLQVFGIIAMFCLSMGVFNNGMLDFPDRRDDYSFSMLILSNTITIAFSVVLVVVYPVIQGIVGIDYPLLFLMIGVFLFQPAYNFWVARQRYEYKYKYVMLWAVICAIISPLAAIILCLKSESGNRLYPMLFGAEITLIIIYIGFYFYLAKKSRFKVDFSFWKTALLFNLPLIPHYLSTYLLNSSDRIMISHLVSNSAAAYYSVAYSVAAVATIVWSAVNGSLVPYTYEKCKERNFKAISKVTIPILTLFAVVCLFVIMLAPEVVAIMATRDYREAIYVIPPIVGGVFFQVQYYIYANVVYYYKKPKYVMFASVTATIANLILNYVFIKSYGYIAAGYTTLFCYIIQAIIDYIAMKKVVKEQVYNMKFIFALSLAVIMVALVSNIVYDIPIVRYSVIAIILLIGFIRRKDVIRVVFDIRNK
jgi:O-antigen/teichoic acid export membrane protein